MKRKGLIVSSIVMVIVLIASLTTATYAWFSASSIAEVQNIQLNTVTSEGLEIGALAYPGSYSTLKALTRTGDVTYNANGTIAGDQQGSSSAIKFTITPTFMGVSGDGSRTNTWSAHGSDGSKYVEQGGTNPEPVTGVNPNYVGAATAGTYFGQDFVITDTKKSGLNLVIQKVTIEAVNSTKSGYEADFYKMIAASARIAIYAAPAVNEEEVHGYVDTAYPAFVYKAAIEPYSSTYLSATGDIVNDTQQDPTVFLKDVQKATASVEGDGYKQVSSTGPKAAAYSVLYENDAPKTLHQGAFSSNLIRLESDTVLGTISYTTPIVLGTYSSSTPYIAVRVAIWFEGEDDQCIADFAKGAGIKVGLEFAKKTA